MLQYLIGVTDNTFISAVIAALLIRMLYIYNVQPKRKVILGIVIGTIAALIYAILKRNTGFIVREYYDLGLLSVWMVIIIPTLVLMWLLFINKEAIEKEFIVKEKIAQQANTPSKQSIIKSLFNLCLILNIAIVFAMFMPNLFLFPFEFDVGMNSISNTDYLFKWVGYWTAILVMLIMSVFICRVIKQLSITLVLMITTVAFIAFTIQNFITIAQILIVRRFIAYQQWLMDLVMFVLSHVNFFIFIFIIISLLLALILYLKGKTTPLRGQDPAQIRRVKANIRRDRRSSIMILAGIAVTAYTVTRLRYIYEKGVEISPAEPVTATNGLIVLPLEQVNDGNLHRFGYEASDSTIVRFIIIKKSENAYGVGLDACDICGASGYYQRGDQVVCSLCDVVMNIATIGFPGGCNPVPIKFEVRDGGIMIKASHLEAEKRRFQ